MAARNTGNETVRQVLAEDGIVLPEDRLALITEAVRAYRTMADALHDDLPESAEPAGLEIPPDLSAVM